MQFKRIATLGASSLLLILSACSASRQVRESLNELGGLQSEAAKKFPGQQITFNITMRSNGKLLTIRFVNSPWNELPAADKAVKALEIARWAYATDSSRTTLDQVTVLFGKHASYGGVVSVQSDSGAFPFPAKQLAAANSEP